MSWAELQNNIGYQFKNSDWLVEAFCHRSYHKENPSQDHNEKLEFLGDAVLDLIISDMLMEKFQSDKEGSLSRKRASLVNEERLCQLALRMGLQNSILIGEREVAARLRGNPRILASVFEALIGAIYKDGGFAAVDLWTRKIFAELLDEVYENHDFEGDYKTRFQEWVQEKYKTTPRYRLIGESGPDHDRVFEMEVRIGEEIWGRAEGSSKKSAAQNAAREALKRVPQ